MKKLIVIAIIVLNVQHAQASGKSVINTSVEILKFTAGAITAYALHEGSHALVAEATDTELTWRYNDLNIPSEFHMTPEKDSDGVIVHMSGLITEAISSEIILRKDSIDKNNNFVRGLMSWNIGNGAIYSTTYLLKGHDEKELEYKGDIQSIEFYSNKNTATCFALSTLAIVAVNSYRFLKTQSWLHYKNRFNVNIPVIFLVPTSNNGFMLEYRKSF